MKLQEFLDKVGKKESDIVEYVTEEDQLAAVKQNGGAIQYIDKNSFDK